jgi:uncharacterized protein YraI
MMKRALSIAALGISVFAIPAAFGADGYVTGNVNLRAGPDSSYPSVARLPEGAEVAIEGCVDGWSWCDVAAGNNRGWVAGNFLQEEYQGQRVLIPEYGVRIGIPVVSFVFGTYWDNNYRNRSWYGNREHWSQVTPQYRQMEGHADWHGDMHQDSNTHSHANAVEASQPSHQAVHSTSTVSRQAVVVPTHASSQYKAAKPVVSPHPVATPSPSNNMPLRPGRQLPPRWRSVSPHNRPSLPNTRQKPPRRRTSRRRKRIRRTRKTTTARTSTEASARIRNAAARAQPCRIIGGLCSL